MTLPFIYGDSIPTCAVDVTGTDLPSVFDDHRDILVKVIAVALVMTPISLIRNISKLEKVYQNSKP